MAKQHDGRRRALFAIGILVLGTSFFAGLTYWGRPSRRIGDASTDVRRIHSIAEQFRRAHDGKCTTPLELQTETRELAIVDPWGTAYAIHCDELVTRAVSFGPDAKEGTADDIVWPP